MTRKLLKILYPLLILISGAVIAGIGHSSFKLNEVFSFDPPPEEESGLPKVEDRKGDPFSNKTTKSKLAILPEPSNKKTVMELDSNLNTYTITEQVGDEDYRPPSSMTIQEFAEWKRKESIRKYWNESNGIGIDPDADDDPFRIQVKKNGKPVVDLLPQGNVTIDFGLRFQRVDNPAIPVRQQKTGGFDFDQQISLNLKGSIGDRLKIKANWDTKATFDFDNSIKIAYEGKEEDIIKDIQVGNVSMPLNNSLIRGAQNLFGVKATLKFGKIDITTLVSNQRGTTETYTVKGGAASRGFEFKSSNYEYNKNFFLAHYFRQKFEEGYDVNPTSPNNGIRITRMEVYITNSSSTTSQLNNMVAFSDLGEGDITNNIETISRINNPTVIQTTVGTVQVPHDERNNLWNVINADTNFREDNQTVTVLREMGFEPGSDFEKINSARLLLDSKDYTFHPELGYISLTKKLQDDEALAVAYQYTYNGRSYQVGELKEDYSNLAQNNVIVLKLLKPQAININLPTWDLMMKNIYSLGTSGIQREEFQLRIIYRDDQTGVDNPLIQDGNTTLRNTPIIQLMNMDTLTQNGDFGPDGNFDFIEGGTVLARKGKLIFPVVEPFGESLDRKFVEIDNSNESFLNNKYRFDDLYDKTQNNALQNTQKDKFYIIGSYKSTSSSSIILPGINIAEGSVSILAGSTTLREGSDYSVDYSIGRVTILNAGILASGKDIIIRYEKADLFSFRVKSLVGARVDYRHSQRLNIGATILHASEKPLISRVSIGDEPIKNTQIGMDVKFKDDSRILTKLVDALPVISTSKESKVDLYLEGAMIKPGHNKLIEEDGEGVAYIDDFEGAETPFDFTRVPTRWTISSTPRFLGDELSSYSDWLSDSLPYSYHRAKLSWYTIDQTFYTNPNSNGFNITDEEFENNYTRQIFPQEYRPGFQNPVDVQELAATQTFDLTYYPEERGQYNYNPDEINTDGKFMNPQDNWAGIVRPISFDTDFEKANIEYIEFWVMDPFQVDDLNEALGSEYSGLTINDLGGDLYFNLGDVSEDVVKDGAHAFENGLPDNSEETIWGEVTTQQFITNAFDNQTDRSSQDVGLDGINSATERTKFQPFIDAVGVAQGTGSRAYQDFNNDPATDDFTYFNLGDNDSRNTLERYKNFNGLENNSPVNQVDGIVRANKTIPDNEDLNNDKTLGVNDNYYQYKLHIDPTTFTPDNNDYIVAENASTVSTATGTNRDVTWYQVRIPLSAADRRRVGDIEGFNTIKYFRMYMTGFKKPLILRMADFKLVSAQWRRYTGNLQDEGPAEGVEPKSESFFVSTVNIEENGNGTTDVSSSYVLPPGAQRDFDQSSVNNRELNEQSLKLTGIEVRDGKSEAVFKNMNLDLLYYKRVNMFIHGEVPVGVNTSNGEVEAFMRLGTDQTDNYYEIALPVRLSDVNNSSDTEVWPEENEIDIAVQDIIDTKLERDRLLLDGSWTSSLKTYSRRFGKYILRVRGRPDLTEVHTVLLGMTNPKDDGIPKSMTLWFNELRAKGFEEKAGYAATGTVNAQLADLGTVQLSGGVTTVGWGDIESKISDRSRETKTEYGVAANLAMDKFIPGKTGIKLPIYTSFDKKTVKPQFDPTNKDVKMDDAVELLPDHVDKEEFKEQRIYKETVSTIQIQNMHKEKVKKDAKNHIYDVENFSLSLGYTEKRKGGVGSENSASGNSIAQYIREETNGSLEYKYKTKGFKIEPFKKAKWKSKYFKLLKDFNLDLMPTSFSVKGALMRNYTKTQLFASVNNELTTSGVLPTYEKRFTFDRFYTLRWNLTKSISLNYTATANALIDEPYGGKDGNLNTKIEDEGQYRDSVMENLRKFGRMKNYKQTFTANYKVPLQKIPLLNWTSGTVGYKSGYNWTASALGLVDTTSERRSMGNLASNTQGWDVSSKLNFEKLYNKSKFLKSANNMRKKPKRKTTKTVVKTPKVKVDKKDSNYVKPVKPKSDLRGVKSFARFLMMVRNVNARYSNKRFTTLPGLLSTPRFFGVSDEDDYAPGAGFVFGSQDLTEIKSNGEWLSKSITQNSPIVQGRKKDYSLNSSIEPFKSFRIKLSTKYSETATYSEIYRYNDTTDVFNVLSPVYGGAVEMSYVTLQTAFWKDDGKNVSAAFEQLKANRNIIKGRLEAEDESGIGTYGLNSQQVLIPAFLAAYTDDDATTSSTRAIPKFPLPNWKLDWNGLSRSKLFKKKFSSISISHSYSSTYQISSYTSSLDYEVNDRGELANGSVLDTNGSGEYKPVLVINDIRIQEKFSPLIGFNIRTRKNMSFKIAYNKSRDLNLSLSNAQLTEMSSEGLTFGWGYTKKKFVIPFIKKKGTKVTLPNSITFKVDVTMRDTRTVQRSLVRNVDPTSGEDLGTNVVTSGNLNWQIRPVINYIYNKRVNIQFFFERTINEPRISSSYRRTSSAGGIKIRFSLT